MKKNKTKIIVLSVLLGLAAVMLIVASVMRATWSKKPDAEPETQVVAAITPDDDSGLSVQPMSWIGGAIGGAIEGAIQAASTVNVYGTLHAGDYNTVVSNNSYTNKHMGFTAPSGFDNVQYASPANDHKWSVTVIANRTMLSNSAQDGWYYFRGYNSSNKNVTQQSGICLDKAKPQVQARVNGSSVANGSVTTSSSASISVFGSDDRSGINTYWYSTNGGVNYYQCYSSTSFTGNGTYTFYCVDRAGNVSDTVTVTKDTVAPTVKAYNGSSQIGNGAIVNASSVRFEATDATTGVAGIYIRVPGSSTYTNYGTAATLSTAGMYYYYAKDKAGNTSSTYSFTVDRTVPTVQLYSGTTSVSSGYSSAASYVRFTATDTNGCTVYMKKDSGSYSTYSSGTNLTAEGVYSFYAKDPAGNTSSTYTITLDRTAPSGTLKAGTTTVSSGKITNASYVTYTATDNYALNYLYVKKPGASSYVTFTSGTHFTADGWYYFYAMDKSGNTSATVSILLDKAKPTLTIKAGTTTVPSGSYTNKSYVSFAASDATSGVSSMYVRLPGSGSYISYVAGTPFYGEGVYYFYATDAAGNIADTVNVTLDTTSPTGTLTTKNASAASGSYTNAAFSYSAADSISGVAKCEIKRPGGVWETYTAGTVIATSSVNGWYYFRSTDRAGNVSDESKICLIKTAPTVSISAGGTTVPSGSITNAGYVSFSGNGAVDGIKELYIKTPDSNGFISYAAGTPMYKEGTYSFYAVDHAGNISSTVTVTLDTSSPVGVITADGETVVSGGYVNKEFSYLASDAVSGIARYEIKRPNGDWTSYDGNAVTLNSSNGWYAFRAIDRAGNVSEESRVYLLTAAPDTTIYAETTAVPSGSITNKSYVRFSASANSDTTSMFVKLPGANGFIAYADGTPLYAEGTYYFYAVDSAGNESETVNVTLDTSKPVGTIAVGGNAVTEGSYINKAFTYAATDAVSGIARYEIKRPGGNWTSYDGSEIAIASGDGLYAFRAIDRAGNVSAESTINLLTEKPTVQLYANEQPVSSGTYTNAARIAMSADGKTATECFVKQPGENGIMSYNQYFSFSAVGRYEFYAVDAAGNKSEVGVIVIDRTAKPVEFSGVTGGKTDGDVIISWTDGDAATTAPIVSVTVNGKVYEKGSTIKTIDGGVYNIKTIDAAGNVRTDSFTANRKEVLSDTLNKKYWEAKDGEGNAYAFGTYENALEFAKAREAALIKTAVWNGETWDGGIPMDGIDSVNAKNGTYYIYKKSGDPTVTVAYFTLERLNAVIAEYAERSVTAYWWWQKKPSEIYVGNDLYALTADKVFIGSSVTLAQHANYLIDGTPYIGQSYDIEGEHILTVFDDYGNSYEYTLIIVRNAPDILYSVGGGVWNTANGERQYALKESVSLKIDDSLCGDFAMYVIRNSADETLRVLCIGEEYVISESGRYTIQAINHFGWSEEIRFILSLNSPAVSFTDNADTKRLEVRIEQSGDSGTSLESVKIYISYDGGETWELLETDDYGRVIGADKLFYEFNKDGLYRVVVADNFRSGIDAVVFQQEYTKPEPEGKLTGVADGGYTNGAVRFTWTDEAEARIRLNGGEWTEYRSGSEITADGEYELEFTDANGYCREYRFTIDTAAPTGVLTGVETDGLTNETVTFVFDETDIAAMLYLNGELVGEYNSGTEIIENGRCKIVLTDKAGNITEYAFEIDTVKPEAELSGVNNGGQTGGSVSLKNPNKACSITATKDGVEFSYEFGETIAAEGSYIIVLTDNAGNETVYEFEIVYAVNAAGTVVIIIVIVAVLGGIGLVLFMRKRKAFKKK